MTTETKYTGVVEWFGGNGRNYGFIQPNGGGPQVFVHGHAVGRAGLREIKKGDHLEFIIEVDPKNGKPKAANLRIIR
jgi:CspA family cold shock protein